MNARLALILPIVLLAACDKGEPTRVTINADSNAAEDKRRVKIGTDGFKADIDIPGLAALGSRMKIDGVPLYPDSKVSGINVNDRGGRDAVAIRFTSPAEQPKVAQWFAEKFADARFKAKATPTGFAGETSDGEWFTLDLSAAGAQTQGEFRLGKAAS